MPTPQPHTHNPCRVSHAHGLAIIRFRSPLLTESLLFSLPTGTEMFHFPAFPPHTLYIQVQVTRHHSRRVSPFGHPRITARLTAPRGLSQPPTSFIGSSCQGIHRVLLHTYNTNTTQNPPENRNKRSRSQQGLDDCITSKKDTRVHCTILKQHTTTNHHPHMSPCHSRRCISGSPETTTHMRVASEPQQCDDNRSHHQPAATRHPNGTHPATTSSTHPRPTPYRPKPAEQ